MELTDTPVHPPQTTTSASPDVDAAQSATPEVEPHPAWRSGRRRTDAGVNGWRQPLTIGFFAIAALVLAFLMIIYSPLAQPLTWAVAFALLVYPAHARLVRVVGGRETLAAVLSTLLWLTVVVGPSFMAVGQLISETRELWPRLLALFGGEVFENLADWVEGSRVRHVAYLILEVPDGGGAAELESRFKGAIDAFASFLLNKLRNLTWNAPTAVFHMSLTVVSFGFLLRQGPELLRGFKELLPIEPSRAEALVHTVGTSVNAVFRGVLLTAVSQGVLAMFGFVVVGAPVPVLLGFLTLIASLIPFVGAVAVWLPTAIGLYLAGKVGAAIGLALWGALCVSLVDNFLRPYFIRRGMRLPILWLFLALIGGLQTFGFLGILLGPAALALFIACHRIYMQDRRNSACDTVPDRSRGAV